MRFVTTFLMVFFLLNFQILSDVIQMSPETYNKIIKSIDDYNKNIENPEYLISIFESTADKKFTANLIGKNQIKKLQKIIKVGNNSWQIKNNDAVINFNIASISKGIIYINDKDFNLNGHSSVEELSNKIILVIKNNPLKKASFFHFFKELLFKDAHADGATTALIIAGIIGLFAAGTFIIARSSKRKSRSIRNKRKKAEGDTDDTGEIEVPGIAPTKFSVTQISGSQDHGFFSLKVFNGKLYGGGFGYAGKQMIHVYDGTGKMVPVSPGFTVKESVCALEEFDGHLYANTESTGRLFRSKDGNNWEEVFKGPTDVGCGLTTHGGYIYAINSHFERPSGYIYRSKTGNKGSWEKVYSSGNRLEYLRDIVSFNGSIYAFHVKGGLVSTNGTNWQAMNTPARMFRSHVAGNKVIIGSGKMYSNSKESAIWSFDGSNFTKLYSTPSMSHIGNVHTQRGNILAITTVDWKGKQGGASLVASCDGGKTFKTIHTFEETEGWAIEEYKGNMYVGTKQDGGGGQIYEVIGFCNASGTSDGGTAGTSTDQGDGTATGDDSEYYPRYHHTTSGSADGGTSIVLCPGQEKFFDHCNVGDVHIPYHGKDEGRHAYWNMHQVAKGDMICTGGGKTYKFIADLPNRQGSCN